MVKTRLCPPLRAAEAADLAEAMLRDVVERLGSLPGSFHTSLYYAPHDDPGNWFRESCSEVSSITGRRSGSVSASAWPSFFREELVGTVGSTAVAVGQ